MSVRAEADRLVLEYEMPVVARAAARLPTGPSIGGQRVGVVLFPRRRQDARHQGRRGGHAGAPTLLARYRNAAPAAKALIDAAIDARRLGQARQIPDG